MTELRHAMVGGFGRYFRAIAFGALLGAGTLGMAFEAAAAGDFFAGYDAYERGDYDAARNAWMPLALAGDVDAQFNLGTLYENGLGVKPDATKAARWYQEAARRRLGLAQVALVRLQRAGAIDSKVVEDGIRLLETAARRGSAEAQYELGVAYDRGLGVTQNFATAAGWYQRAAEQGLADAQYNVAALYDQGLGTARDPARALEWYTRAADAGEPRAMNNLGYLYEKGFDGPQDYAKAVSWYRRAARSGLAIAQSNLAALYYLGHGVERDLERAARWYREAAEQGDTVGQNGLGLLYANGLGVERDLVEAMALFTRAAEAGGPVGAEAADHRTRIEGLLTPDQRSAALARSRELALSAQPSLADDPNLSGISLPRPSHGFGDNAIRVQRLLKTLDYYDATVDGIPGPMTFKAIQRFLRQNKIRMTPKITQELVETLETARIALLAPAAGNSVERRGAHGRPR